MMERTLIEEDRDQIESLRAHAKRNESKLNRAYAVAPFRSFEELKKLVEDCPQFIRDEMRKNKLTRELMDRGVKVDVPDELIRRTQILTEALECFEFTLHTGTGYEINEEALHLAEDRYRRFVETPFQVQTWQYQTKLIDALNSNPLPTLARRRNYPPPGNEFVQFNERTQRWERNKWVLLHATENDYKF